jgi:V-type H+-transporting ATPase subunit a
MGFFSMYTGLIYNDFFSKSLNIFGSVWYVPYSTLKIAREKEIMLDPKDAFEDTAYPIGIDPVWQVMTS